MSFYETITAQQERLSINIGLMFEIFKEWLMAELKTKMETFFDPSECNVISIKLENPYDKLPGETMSKWVEQLNESEPNLYFEYICNKSKSSLFNRTMSSVELYIKITIDKDE